jgi:DNA polymerase I-like protein with 3'-5' exonuclease and polymerase domains
MREMYGIDFDVPLDVEIKAGSNWLDTSVFV